jgi:hypothetical protein
VTDADLRARLLEAGAIRPGAPSPDGIQKTFSKAGLPLDEAGHRSAARSIERADFSDEKFLDQAPWRPAAVNRICNERRRSHSWKIRAA